LTWRRPCGGCHRLGLVGFAVTLNYCCKGSHCHPESELPSIGTAIHLHCHPELALPSSLALPSRVSIGGSSVRGECLDTAQDLWRVAPPRPGEFHCHVELLLQKVALASRIGTAIHWHCHSLALPSIGTAIQNWHCLFHWHCHPGFQSEA